MYNTDNIGEISILPDVPSGKYDLDRVIEVEDGTLIVELKNNHGKKIVISFGNGTLAYQRMEEECDLKRVDKLMSYLEEKNIEKNTLYLVKESPMINEIREKSCGIRGEDDLNHYLIVSSNYLMDIIIRDECIVLTDN